MGLIDICGTGEYLKRDDVLAFIGFVAGKSRQFLKMHC